MTNLGASYGIFLDSSQPNETDREITTSLTDEGLTLEGSLDAILQVVAYLGHVVGCQDIKYGDGLENLCEGFANAGLELNTDTNVGTLHLPDFTVD